MALNNGSKSTQQKAAPAAKAETAKAPEVKKVKVYLAMGASYFHEGFRFERDTVYEVAENFGHWLLDLEAHGDAKKFEEAGRAQKDLPVVQYDYKSNQVAGVETAEDLAEIQAHLDNGPAATEEGGPAGEGEGAGEGAGEGKGEVEL
ncbi:MAG: hypothetical protein RR280_01435 [Bacteroidaceae bacterium]